MMSFQPPETGSEIVELSLYSTVEQFATSHSRGLGVEFGGAGACLECAFRHAFYITHAGSMVRDRVYLFL